MPFKLDKFAEMLYNKSAKIKCAEFWGLMKKTINYNNGNKYVGEVNEGIPDEYGKFYFNGGVYEGEFSHGFPNGMGKVTYKNGDIFEGYYRDGIRSSGKYYFANGDLYIGTFNETTFHGKGRMKWTNGDDYDGEWSYGKKNGFGTFSCFNGNIFIGNFKDDEKVNGRYSLKKCGATYDGAIYNEKFNGKGTLKLPNGMTIDGTFVDGLPSGECTVTLLNGDSFSCVMEDGQPKKESIRWIMKNHLFSKADIPPSAIQGIIDASGSTDELKPTTIAEICKDDMPNKPHVLAPKVMPASPQIKPAVQVARPNPTEIKRVKPAKPSVLLQKEQQRLQEDSSDFENNPDLTDSENGTKPKEKNED